MYEIDVVVVIDTTKIDWKFKLFPINNNTLDTNEKHFIMQSRKLCDVRQSDDDTWHIVIGAKSSI